MTSVTWIDALNNQADWHKNEDVHSWLSAVFARDLHPSRQAVTEFTTALDFMRKEIGKSHFGQPIDVQSINRSLEGLRLIVTESVSQGSRLPHMHVVSEGDSDDCLVMALQQTLFFQFAHFIAEFLESPSAPLLMRCEGLFREEETQQHQSQNEMERQFRQEIPLLVEADLVDHHDIQRCSDLFVMRPKAKFCSDACRFTTFQITKQIKDPKYLAEKQRRYRQRLN